MSIGGTSADWLLLAATAVIAWHGLTWREITGVRSWVHLLIGAIALVFCLRTLVVSILGVT